MTLDKSELQFPPEKKRGIREPSFRSALSLSCYGASGKFGHWTQPQFSSSIKWGCPQKFMNAKTPT